MKIKLENLILILIVGLSLAPLAPLLNDHLPLESEDGLINSIPYSSSNLQTLIEDSEKQFFKESKVSDEPIKILFDEAHTTFLAGGLAPGPVSMMGAFLETLGFECDVNLDNELTPEYLSSYQVLVIFFPQGNFTTSETSAIIDFVQSGGSLLVSGKGGWTYDPFMKFKSSNLNSITQKMNVTYFDYLSSLDDNLQNFLNHPLATNVSRVKLEMYVGKFTIDPGADVFILANQSTGDPAFAFREFGEGRVFFSCSDSNFANLKGANTEDHFQFVANIFNWLTGKTVVEVEYPGWMQVPIRKDYTTTETQRRNYKMLLGVTHVHSEFVPITDQVDRAIELDLEFLTITDHQNGISVHGDSQASWEVARLYIETNNITDFNLLYGVEGDVDQIGHHSIFGITEILNTQTAHTQAEWPEIIDTYHSQGGAVFIAHPLGCCGIPNQDRIDYFNNFTNIGLDGFEIVDGGWFGTNEGGSGEWAYLVPFTGGADAHSTFTLNRTLMYVFVEENTDENIIEAILDRRALVIDYYQTEEGLYYQNLVIGDQQWLDEFAYRNGTVHSQYDVVSSLITNASLAGWDVSDSNTKLASAKRAIRNFNHDKARRIFGEIVDSLYTINITTDSTDYNAGDQITVSVSVHDQTPAAIPVSVTAELLNSNKTRILSTTSISDESAEDATLILDIPGNSTSGNYSVNVLLSINETIVTKKFEMAILADTTPPTVTITSPQSQETINQTSLEVTWTVSETGTGLHSQIISVDGSQIVELTEITTRSYTLTLTEGTHTIKVQALDVAGNIGEDEVQITVKTSVATTTSTTADSTPAFSWVIIVVTLVGATARKIKNR